MRSDEVALNCPAVGLYKDRTAMTMAQIPGKTKKGSTSRNDPLPYMTLV